MIAGPNPIGTIMDRPNTLLVYSDYKSPYAFLAKDLIYELEDQFDVHLEWLPYTLDIPSYLGSATLDERGEVIESNRNAHQWRRVRYSYMDCRRQARKRGLVILGTRTRSDIVGFIDGYGASAENRASDTGLKSPHLNAC